MSIFCSALFWLFLIIVAIFWIFYLWLFGKYPGHLLYSDICYDLQLVACVEFIFQFTNFLSMLCSRLVWTGFHVCLSALF